MTKKKVAIYLHIPFCVQKCYYCDFLSAPAEERIKTLYVEALLRECEYWKERISDYEVTSLFVGIVSLNRFYKLWFTCRLMHFIPYSGNMRHHGIIVIHIFFFPNGFKQFLGRNNLALFSCQIPHNIKLQRCQCNFLSIEHTLVTDI